MRIIFIEKFKYLPSWAKEKISLMGDLEIYEDHPDPDTVLARASSADIVVLESTDFPRPLLGKCKLLKAIVVARTGFEFIDIKAAREYGISVHNTPEYATRSVSEYVLGLLFHFCRDFQSRPETKPQSIGKEILGKTIGIIGLGRIGRSLASLAFKLGMNVLGYTRFPQDLDDITLTNLETVVPASDFIVICTDSIDSPCLLSQNHLRRVKNGAVLINISSPTVWDESGLLELLSQQKLKGLAFEECNNKELLNFENTRLISSRAYFTTEAMEFNINSVILTIESILAGHPINQVN